ncbi:MAG TPA: DNA internalization-related competence protein ComEC/Rec2 [Desulfomonilaceae bacterium]|nr:DNA internalization-related competence protein ComEC/Rec2 [Desulfomonilaceae bacterium]
MAFLCAGIAAAAVEFRTLGKWSVWGLVPALVLVLVSARKHVAVWLRIGIALLFFGLGFHVTCRDLLWGTDFDPPLEKQVVHATVWKMWASGPEVRVILLEDGLNATNAAPLPGLGRLVIRDNTGALHAGDRIAFRSRIRIPLNRCNPGEYDWETDCRHNGILWLASIKGPDAILVLSRGRWFTPNALLFSLRNRMDKFLDEYGGVFLHNLRGISHDDRIVQVRGFHKGVVLGDLGDVDYGLTKAFADSGLVHVLSASGLHVGIVVLLTALLVKICVRLMPRVQLWLPFKKLCALASMPSVVIYCLLVGARVPAIRSMIMGLVIGGALLLDRKWNSINSLALAGLIILLLYPLSLFTPSFQLSFACVAGIFVVVPELSKILNERRQSETTGKTYHGKAGSGVRIIKWFVAVLVTSAAATLAVTPLVLQNFHSFPVHTLAANVASDFLLAPSLSLGLIASLLGTILPNQAAWILAPADVLVLLVIEIAFFFSGLPYSTVRVPHLSIPGFIACVGFAMLSLWFLRAPSWNKLKKLGVGVIVLAIIPVSCGLFRNKPRELRAVFLNVGKADATFVQPAGSRGFLVDAGMKTEYFDTGRSIVAPFLDWAGCSSLDAIMISHPEMDHMGGIPSVMLRARPSALWWNPVGAPPPYLAEIFSSAERKNVRILSGDRTCPPIRIGSATVRFLNRRPPHREKYSHKDVNNASLVVRVECENASMLFTGDLEQEGEAELLAAGMPLSADVLKVGHHGSAGASSVEFVKAVRPKIAVIPADYPNIKNFPGPRVLETLRSVGAEVFWTGRDGAVTIEAEGNSAYVTTGRSDALGRKIVRKEFRLP